MHAKEKTFIFHDPSGRRWIRFRRGFKTFGIFAGMLLVLLALAAFSNPQLPTLGLPEVQRLAAFSEVRSIIRGETAPKNVPFKRHKATKKPKYPPSPPPPIPPPPPPTAT